MECRENPAPRVGSAALLEPAERHDRTRRALAVYNAAFPGHDFENALVGFFVENDLNVAGV